MARVMEAISRAKARRVEFRSGGQLVEQPHFSLRTVFWILATGACYYLATRTAWALTFPESKVSLFFPPHAVLVSILLLVPTRHWWAYTLAAACTHYFATQQEDWPPLYALQCEVFDAVKNVLAAAGIRLFIKSPFNRITLREAVIFVLIALVIVPFGTAFWGAAFTVSYNFGTDYWVEWRNLGVSNGVTAIVLVPAILLGVHLFRAKRINVAPRRILEAGLLAANILAVAYVVFDRLPAGPDTSPALLYAPIPLLVLGCPPLWAGRYQRLHAGHHDSGDLGNDAGTRAVPGTNARGKCACPAVVPAGGCHSADVARSRHR